jgi:hypothetical protein
MHGARLGEREAVSETQSFRRGIDRDEEVEIAAFAEDNEGL